MNKHYSLDEVNFISEKISGGTSPEADRTGQGRHGQTEGFAPNYPFVGVVRSRS